MLGTIYIGIYYRCRWGLDSSPDIVCLWFKKTEKWQEHDQ